MNDDAEGQAGPMYGSGAQDGERERGVRRGPRQAPGGHALPKEV